MADSKRRKITVSQSVLYQLKYEVTAVPVHELWLRIENLNL
jgi:hypothetical protein